MYGRINELYSNASDCLLRKYLNLLIIWAGEMTSEVGGTWFQGGQGHPSEDGKVIGFAELFFEKGPIQQNNKKTFSKKVGPPGGPAMLTNVH